MTNYKRKKKLIFDYSTIIDSLIVYNNLLKTIGPELSQSITDDFRTVILLYLQSCCMKDISNMDICYKYNDKANKLTCLKFILKSSGETVYIKSTGAIIPSGISPKDFLDKQIIGRNFKDSEEATQFINNNLISTLYPS